MCSARIARTPSHPRTKMERKAPRRTKSARGHSFADLGLTRMDETLHPNQATMNLNPELKLGLTRMDERHRLLLLDHLKRQWEEVF